MRRFIIALMAAGIVLALPVLSYCEDEATEQAAKAPIDITPSGTGEKGQMYSIELRDTDLVDLFRFLAHEYKLNLLVSDTVQGKITATFTNVSLEEALDEIAESQNLLIEKKNNFLRISPNLVTKVIVLRNLEAKTLLNGSGGEAAERSGPGNGGSAGARASVGDSSASSSWRRKA